MKYFFLTCICLLCDVCWTLDDTGQTSQSQFDRLSNEIDVLKAMIKKLILSDRNKEAEIDVLKSTMEKLVLTDRNMDMKLRSLQQENANLLKRVAILEENNTYLLHEIYNTKEDELHSGNHGVLSQTTDKPREELITSQAKNLTMTKKEIHDHRQNPWKKDVTRGIMAGYVPVIGFTAHRYLDDIHVNPGHTIIFNHVISNLGSRYNPNTGVFTVDTTGIYVFYVNLLCFQNRVVQTDLVRDGVKLSRQICYGTASSDDNGSSMTVVELQEGVSVWVRVRYVDNNDAKELGSETTFSGFLLQPTYN